jgi:hypothetical protein
VQVTPDDSSVLRLAGNEDMPLVLNAQHLEWDEIQAPTDIVQANHDFMVAVQVYFLSRRCTYQVSANLLDIAVSCAMRKDGFSVNGNGKLGQPADVAVLMKEAQVRLFVLQKYRVL